MSMVTPEQLALLEDIRSKLQKEKIATYSVLLQVSSDTVEAIHCTLDTRGLADQHAAAERVEQVQALLQPHCQVPVEVCATGHPYVHTQKEETRTDDTKAQPTSTEAQTVS